MRVAVLEHRRAEQKPALAQVCQHLFVGILAEDTGPFGLFCHFALGVHKLHKGQAIAAAHLRVVLAKGGRNVHNAGAVRQGDIIGTGDIPAFFLRAYKIEQRGIFAEFQVFAHIALQYIVGALAQHGVGQGGGQVIYGAVLVHAHLHIFLGRVHAQRNV